MLIKKPPGAFVILHQVKWT